MTCSSTRTGSTSATHTHTHAQVLGPALNDLLLHTDWQYFNSILPRYTWSPESVDAVCAADAAWCAQRAVLRAQRQQAKQEEGTKAEQERQEAKGEEVQH